MISGGRQNNKMCNLITRGGPGVLNRANAWRNKFKWAGRQTPVHGPNWHQNDKIMVFGIGNLNIR